MSSSDGDFFCCTFLLYCFYPFLGVGDTAVGKSSSVERFVKNEFFEFQQPTIGAAFLTQSVQLDDVIVKFEIWDTVSLDRCY